jgi:MerR family transcriptional regulator, thiopeptide resistance regulator
MTTHSDIQAVLVYDDIEGSQQYLVKTFGFISGELHRAPDGTAVHGEVTTGSTTIWMHRVAHEHGLDSPKNLGYASGQLVVYVDDVDAHHQRVAAARGRPATPAPVDQAYGLRDYSVFDNEGHLWTFATPI